MFILFILFILDEICCRIKYEKINICIYITFLYSLLKFEMHTFYFFFYTVLYSLYFVFATYIAITIFILK